MYIYIYIYEAYLILYLITYYNYTDALHANLCCSCIFCKHKIHDFFRSFIKNQIFICYNNE